MKHEDASSNNLNHSPTENAPKELPYFAQYGQGGAINVIPDGGLIPVGGSLFGQDMTEILLQVDISAFDRMFDEVLADTQSHDLNKMTAFMQDVGLITDSSYFPPEVFIHMYVLTRKITSMYPVNIDGLPTRDRLYKTGEQKLTLSFIMEQQLAACAEYAALAQAYLQKVGIASTWFSGDILLSRDREFAEKHTFIILHLEQGDFIYDPAMPLRSTSGASYPKIVKLTANFLEQMRLGKGRRFVAGYDLLSKKDAFYGISRGSNIVPQRDIV